jgi:SPP1 family phage portal protein
MTILKTENDVLTDKEILDYINNYEINEIPKLNDLWEYYRGKNVKILTRKPPDPNNPDNHISVGYGRKIVTTFTGYAYRPGYITYKAAEKADELYTKAIKDNFKLNKEIIKTNRAGRNTAIFGVAYEIVYIDKDFIVDNNTVNIKAVPRFYSVDPRELILIYNFESEPKKKVAIRFYKIKDALYKVEVYYDDKIQLYDRIREENTVNKEWKLQLKEEYPNFFGEIPVVAYYFGDEMIGVIDPVITLIDAYDTLVTDSMNEFDRFAFAYLIMKRFGLTDQIKKQEPGMVENTLRLLKRRRIFEHLPVDADIKFLTKDIPDAFISFMSTLLRDQIHIQSHVPDFTSEKMSGASGIAIQRLLFDFENVVSSTEADFDVGLNDRIRLITAIIAKSDSTKKGTSDQISIAHKRNVPLNLKEFADTAVQMKTAGFSRKAIVGIMPDDIIPDKEAELAEQDKDAQALMPNLDEMYGNQNYDQNGNPINNNQGE